MSKVHTPNLGIIEGFFGRAWTWKERLVYAQFLALNKLNFYIYAPKNDANLRKNWQHDWPQETKQVLLQLREDYRQAEVDFGIGLSPHEIYLDNSRDNRHYLTQRVKQINELQPDILCLLFDDMRGDIPNLANIQIDLMHQVADVSTAKHIIFCPTYYSFDPVLEKVFGKRPHNYWQHLQKNLDNEINIFWTGEKVCSPNYSAEHLAEVSDLLGRKPFLWDNYPVNDGAVKSNFLHLRPVDSTHGLIQQQVAGHALNPMNQAWLSQLAIATLPIAYEQHNNYQPNNIFENVCIEICGEHLAKLFLQDIAYLQDQGLKVLDEKEKKVLIKRYEIYPENPFCKEIVAWLNNEYYFDPTCLTE